MNLRAFGVAFVVLGLVAAWGSRAEAAPVKMVLDSDGYADYDDTVAVMAAALSPELDLLGVIATGDDSEGRARTLAKALSIVGRQDVPVYLGESSFSPLADLHSSIHFERRGFTLFPELERWSADFPYTPPAERGFNFLIDVVTQHPHEVAVVVTGTFSTLAQAMRAADDRGTGSAFRAAIGSVLFSGGGFKRAEYNIFVDVVSSRLVFESGVPLYDFPGEGSGMAAMTYERRETWWRARNPATNALKDVFRLYKAGWAASSPYVPLLYDVHPVAYLVRGEEIGRFEPMHVEIAADGLLVRGGGAPNVNVRVANYGDRVVEWATGRLTSPFEGAVNHLRRIGDAGGAGASEAASLGALLQEMSGAGVVEAARVEPALKNLEARLATSGAQAGGPAWDAAMARGYLFGAKPGKEWRDPYTPAVVAVVILANVALRVITHPVVLTAGVAGALALLLMWAFLKQRKARQG